MSNDRAVVKEYCRDEFGRIVALFSTPHTVAEGVAMEAELVIVRATFAAAESHSDRARRADAKASYTRLRTFFVSAYDRMAPTEKQVLAMCAITSGRSMIREWCLQTRVAYVSDGQDAVH